MASNRFRIPKAGQSKSSPNQRTKAMSNAYSSDLFAYSAFRIVTGVNDFPNRRYYRDKLVDACSTVGPDLEGTK